MLLVAVPMVSHTQSFSVTAMMVMAVVKESQAE